MQETFGRPVFLFLILVALLAGICQISIFCSMLTGTQKFVEASIKSGSRLNRVEIKPKLQDRENASLFPERNVLQANPIVESVVGRRESTVRLVHLDNSSNFYTGMGLQQNDPEYRQLHFYAGGRFSSDSALEIILTADLINTLFDADALQAGRESFADFIGRQVAVKIPQFTQTRALRGYVDVNVKVVGIIAAGEGGRQLYLPITAALAIDQIKRDRSGTMPSPFDGQGGWALNADELQRFTDFPWEDRLQVYAHNVRDAIPLYAELARFGYSPQSDIWRYKWVLDIQDLAWKIFIPMLMLIIIVVALTVFANIYSSAKMREKDFALWRILGMRIGDLSFTQLMSTIIIVVIGASGGLLIAEWMIQGARSFLISTANVEYQPESVKNLEMIFTPIAEFVPLILLGALIVGVLAAIFPALRAARTDPAKILQSG